MKTFSKVLSMLIVVVMCVSLMGVSAYAVDIVPAGGDVAIDGVAIDVAPQGGSVDSGIGIEIGRCQDIDLGAGCPGGIGNGIGHSLGIARLTPVYNCCFTHCVSFFLLAFANAVILWMQRRIPCAAIDIVYLIHK